MRLLINTSGIRFRAGGPAKPKNDYRDKEKQAMTPDGRPIWVVRLTAFDTSSERGSSESIWVEVAGDEPKLATDCGAALKMPTVGALGMPMIGSHNAPPAGAAGHCDR
jgi:hypothetical protein